jgi:hypothetical protein
MPVKLFEGKSFPVSVETVVKIVQMLKITGQLNDFLADSKDQKVTVPAETANALKLFLDAKNVAHPMAVSIVGLPQEDCQDYQCPHIHQG